ncbi:MAG: hypothetical protein ACI4F4_00680 [Lachnospiraceae bacterium]
MGRKKIDYISFRWEKSRAVRIILNENQLFGVTVLHIIFKNSYDCDKKRWQRELKKVKRKIRKYDYTNARIHMDEKMEAVFEKTGLAYISRKNELLENAREILTTLRGESNGTRREVLFVLGKDLLTLVELKQLLLIAKDLYEDITVYVEDNITLYDNVFSYMENEWGVVVNRVVSQDKLKPRYESGICIAHDFDTLKTLACVIANCYALFGKSVLYEKNNRGINEKNRLQNKHMYNRQQYKHLYMGYEYYMGHQLLPYEMAVDLLYQYENNYQNNKFQPTFVAICEVKC